jgi:hypothetical protein
VVHVLAAHSTRYRDALASFGDASLRGCSCGSCGGSDLRLTNAWVTRGLQTNSEYGQLAVCLARCRSCGGRERVLPCDVLPGKTNDVGNIFSALVEVQEGVDIAEVARRHDVSWGAVRKWADGATARYLDLAQLYRHRGMIAPSSAAHERLLVQWWTFTAEAHRREGRKPLLPPAWHRGSERPTRSKR